MTVSSQGEQSQGRTGLQQNWQKGPHIAVDGAEKYSRFVRLMRISLPILAISITLLVVIYALVGRPKTQVSLTFAGIDQFEGELAMIKPRFTGLDIENRYFDVLANRAVRQVEDPNKITLDLVDAKITRGGKDLLALTADEGILQSLEGNLQLDSNVVIATPDGHRFTTERVLAQLNDGIIRGDQPIVGDGPAGFVRADSFEVLRDHQSVHLKGNVRMKIDMSFMVKSDDESDN